jgi:hypothetical protein
LSFLFRSKSWALGIAGISAIECDFVENVDLSDLVNGHLQYPKALPHILERLHLED